MNVLITGSPSGQLFHELLRTAPAGVNVLDTSSAGSSRLDITNSEAVMEFVELHKPSVIFNAAAYTAVDKAETDPDTAHAVNTEAVQTLANAANLVGARLVQISTDFVVKTMLRLMNERGEVGVIADQIGTPTWARRLAEAMWQTIDRNVPGIWHWTGAGACSWYDFAMAIAEEGKAAGLITRDVVVNPLRTDQYPTPATRPGYSVLELTKTWDMFELQAPHWREDLRLMLKELS